MSLAVEQRLAYEREHPVKAKLGTREYKALLENEQRAKVAHEQAERAFVARWNDPGLRGKAKKESAERASKIEQGIRDCKELRPAYEQAQQQLDQQLKERAKQIEEQGLYRDRGRGREL